MSGTEADGVILLYLDDDVCAIDKPPDVFVHPNPLDRKARDCVSILRDRLGRFVYNVHRIDRPTSGALLFALNRAAASELSRQLREGEMRKTYLAVVRGHLNEPLLVDAPIPRSKTGEKVEAASTVRPISRVIVPEPVSKYSEGWFTLVEVELHTGRFHQARRHLRIAGHPVIGDTSHGDPAQNSFFRERYQEGRLFLRSLRIEFVHPVSKKRLGVAAGLPDWWTRVLAGAGFEVPDQLLDRSIDGNP